MPGPLGLTSLLRLLLLRPDEEEVAEDPDGEQRQQGQQLSWNWTLSWWQRPRSGRVPGMVSWEILGPESVAKCHPSAWVRRLFGSSLAGWYFRCLPAASLHCSRSWDEPLCRSRRTPGQQAPTPAVVIGPKRGPRRVLGEVWATVGRAAETRASGRVYRPPGGPTRLPAGLTDVFSLWRNLSRGNRTATQNGLGCDSWCAKYPSISTATSW